MPVQLASFGTTGMLGSVLAAADSRNVISALHLFHTGAIKHDGVHMDFVIASSSIGPSFLREGKLAMDIRIREMLFGRYTDIAALLGMDLVDTDRFPGWPLCERRQTDCCIFHPEVIFLLCKQRRLDTMDLFRDKLNCAVPAENDYFIALSGGSRIYCKIWIPAAESAEQRFPAVRMLHGFPGLEQNQDMAPALQRGGFASHRITLTELVYEKLCRMEAR